MSSLAPPKFWVIIPAAGIGSRMQADKPKQYLDIENKTILEHTVRCFLEHPAFDEVYVGISPQDQYFERYKLHEKQGIKTFQGGKERADTVLNGLNYLSDQAAEQDWIWVHDAARPCLSPTEIDTLIRELSRTEIGLVLGVPISDSLKRISLDEQLNGLPKIAETVDRTGLWRAMTPQIFKYSELKTALRYCEEEGIVVTDESSALEKKGLSALMVHGFEQNIKVTLPTDLLKVQEYLLKP